MGFAENQKHRKMRPSDLGMLSLAVTAGWLPTAPNAVILFRVGVGGGWAGYWNFVTKS